MSNPTGPLNRNTTVSITDTDAIPNHAIVFKGKKGEVYRVLFPQPENIFMYSQHFTEGGKYIRCLSDAEQPCPMCQHVGPPITKFKANIVVYNTATADGGAPDLDFVNMNHYVYRFNSKTFKELSAKHKKLAKRGGLKGTDLIFTCTNDQFQHFTIDDANDYDKPVVIMSERLKKMYKIIKGKFVLKWQEDRDARFPTPVEVRTWLTKSTGTAISIDDADDSDAAVSSDLLDDVPALGATTAAANVAGDLPPEADSEPTLPSEVQDSLLDDI